MKTARVLHPSHSEASSLHARRIIGLDLARAIAVIGMIASHIGPAFPLSEVTSGYPSSLFAVLAGCSTAIMMARGNAGGGATLATARHQLLLRGVIIGVIGIGLSAVQHQIAVVLGTIAWIFLLLGPVTRWRTRNLVFLGLGLAFGSALVQALTVIYPIWYPSELAGVYPLLAWLAYGVLGMLIHRHLLHASVAVQATVAVLGMAGYLLSAYARSGQWMLHFGMYDENSLYDGSFSSSTSDFGVIAPSVFGSEATPSMSDSGSWSSSISDDFYTDPLTDGSNIADQLFNIAIHQSLAHTGGIIDIAVSSVAAAGVIATCLLIARGGLLAKALFPVRAIGQMALTAYVIHVVTAGIYLGGAYDPGTPEFVPAETASSSVSENQEVPDSGVSMSAVQPDASVSSGTLDSSFSSGLEDETCSCWSDEDYGSYGGSWVNAPLEPEPLNWWPLGLTLGGLLIACPLWLYWFPRGPFEQVVRSLSIRGSKTDVAPLDA